MCFRSNSIEVKAASTIFTYFFVQYWVYVRVLSRFVNIKYCSPVVASAKDHFSTFFSTRIEMKGSLGIDSQAASLSIMYLQREYKKKSRARRAAAFYFLLAVPFSFYNSFSPNAMPSKHSMIFPFMRAHMCRSFLFHLSARVCACVRRQWKCVHVHWAFVDRPPTCLLLGETWKSFPTDIRIFPRIKQEPIMLNRP